MGAQSRGLIKSGLGSSYLRIFDPREKPLEQSAIPLMAQIQSLARLNQVGPDFLTRQLTT